MWFKQVQVFQLSENITLDVDKLIQQLEPLAFTSCLPSFPSSHGWVTPIDEENAPLALAVNGCMIFCLLVEEKILPAMVIRQELEQKIKEIQATRDWKVSHKEKYALKDEITQTLLPRAFSKLSKVHAYIDTKNQWLILDTVNPAKTETFLELFKKTVKNTSPQPLETLKLAPLLTRWLTHSDYPHVFSVDKSCVLKDPQQQKRVIRCQQQDLFASGIQAIIKDGCEVKQLAITWHDRVNFTLLDTLCLQSIKYEDELIAQAKDMEPETKQQHFSANFFIMAETLAALLKDLFNLFAKNAVLAETEAAMA